MRSRLVTLAHEFGLPPADVWALPLVEFWLFAQAADEWEREQERLEREHRQAESKMRGR